MMASEKGNKEVVALLLLHGVDISTQSDDSALSLAADGGFKGVVDLRIKAGAGPEPRDIDEILDFIKSSSSAPAAASKKKKKKKKKDCQKAKKFEAEAEAVGDKKKGNIPNQGNDDEGRKSEEFPE